MALNNHQTFKKQLTLKSDEASILDLFGVLFTKNIESKQFIDTIRVNEIILERRGIIFLSMLIQKVLQILSIPMFLFGSIIEIWLNLLQSNKNFITLLINLLYGNVVVPDNESAEFRSLIGLFDERVEIDKNIKPEDKRYFPALLAMASKLAYENKAFIKATIEDRWKMEYLGAYDFWNEDQQKYTTQNFIFHEKNHNMIIVVFRGTEPFDADSWCTDFDLSWYKIQGVGKVHYGFMKALGLNKDETWSSEKKHPMAYHTIKDLLEHKFAIDDQTKFILTGHSLGGALAILFPAVLALCKEEKILLRLKAVYTYGQPRVGDKKFGDYMKEQLRIYNVKYYRFVYNHDIVPRIPYDNSALMFKHFGKCVYYNSLYEGKIVEEEPEKNYFSMRSFIRRRLDTLWELVRSFLLPYMYGPDYKESWLLRAFRISGLLIPGVPDHGLADYINAIQLGDYTVFD